MFKFLDFFKKNKKSDEILITELKKISFNENYLIVLEKLLEKCQFENIQITNGEYININNAFSNECCIDIYFEKDYLYMLSIYEDGMVLLKNKHKLSLERDEELDYEEIYRQNIKQKAA